MWSDSFGYADGPLGGPWTIHYGTPTVSGGDLTGEGFLCAVTAIEEGSDADGTVQVSNLGYYSTGLGPAVKISANGSQAYAVDFAGSFSEYQVRILKRSLGSWNVIHTDTVTGDPRNITSVGISYVGGLLSSYVNGSLVGTHSDADYAANTGVGIYAGSTTIHGTAYSTQGWVDPNAPALSILPALVSAQAGQVVLVAYGTNTEWTANPDSTTFTCDQGTITGQTIVTSTRILIYWTPPVSAYETTTFTESQYDLSDTVDSDINLPPGYGQGYNPTPQATDLLDRTGVFCPTGRILTTCEEVEAGSGVSITEGIDAILEQLGGFSGQVGPDIGAVSTPGLLYELWEKQNGIDHWTVLELLQLLGGSPAVYSNSDILDAIAALPGGDNQAVLDAIAAVRGTGNPDIAAVLTAIGNLTAPANSAILNAISALDAKVDLLAAKLTAIQPSTDYTLTSLHVENAAASVDLGNLLNLLGVLMGGESMLTIQMVLDAISLLSGDVQAIETSGAPVWPGLAGVTLGDEVALTDQLVLEGPMHGVLVAVTTPPVGLGGYNVGGHRLDYGQMRCAFVTDRGDIEPWQYFGFRTAIYTPKSMASAEACYFQLAGGLGGTARTWTRS